MICHNCRKQVEIAEKTSLAVRRECPHCLSYLHCCLNCRFYEQGKSNKCAEPQAEWVADKAQANFCDYFETADDSVSVQDSARDEALKKFNSLFKSE